MYILIGILSAFAVLAAWYMSLRRFGQYSRRLQLEEVLNVLRLDEMNKPTDMRWKAREQWLRDLAQAITSKREEQAQEACAALNAAHSTELAKLRRTNGEAISQMEREHAGNIVKQREHARRTTLERLLVDFRMLSKESSLGGCLYTDTPWMEHYHATLSYLTGNLKGRDLDDVRQRIGAAISFLANRLMELNRERTRNAQCLGRLASDAVETCRSMRRIHLTVDKVTDDNGQVDETSLKALNAQLVRARNQLGNSLVLHTATSQMPPQMVLPNTGANWDVTGPGIRFVLGRHRQPHSRDSLRLTDTWTTYLEQAVVDKALPGVTLEKSTGAPSPA